ncbi:hypothetical protein SAMN04488137_4568 [Fictibacillus solisalsi]|uniref:Uncharacterized protein n=1 Tax=Fictibacillus solisalsi TaxID=459525 RepID=A0A1H0BMS8_9BACL|nr:hypothetical protein [Fictibacillus solisalsi]SDN46865.1 hypothetical protein SAMN04488137_4568 [Fictibacillus solisalsi]
MSFEKEALLYRLQMMEEKERSYLKELQRERQDIYDRLRELDHKLSQEVELLASEENITDAAVVPQVPEVIDQEKEAVSEVVDSLPSASGGAAEAAAKSKISNTQAVKNILKENGANMSISQIKIELIDKYGLKPSNLSQLLYKLKTDTDEIISPGRATYRYNGTSQVSQQEEMEVGL